MRSIHQSCSLKTHRINLMPFLFHCKLYLVKKNTGKQREENKNHLEASHLAVSPVATFHACTQLHASFSKNEIK